MATLFLGSSALLWVDGLVDNVTVVLVGVLGLIAAFVSVIFSYEMGRTLSLEETTRGMQGELGFRIERAPSFGQPGSRCVYVDLATGEDRAVQPAPPWAFDLWEFAREQSLLVGQLKAELAASGKAATASGKKVERDKDGDLVVQEKEAETVQLRGLGTQDADVKGDRL